MPGNPVKLSGSAVSVVVFIGLIMLVGIVVKNAIVLIDRINQLREEGVPKRAAIVQAAWAATEAVGMTPEFGPASSTDANLPMSLGIPSIRVCGGGAEGNNHSLDEWYDPAEGYRGAQKLFMTLLGLVGVAGLTEPLLAKRK